MNVGIIRIIGNELLILLKDHTLAILLRSRKFYLENYSIRLTVIPFTANCSLVFAILSCLEFCVYLYSFIFINLSLINSILMRKSYLNLLTFNFRHIHIDISNLKLHN